MPGVTRMIKPTTIPVVGETWLMEERWKRSHTSKYGYDCLMYGLYLPLLQYVTCEERRNEQHDQDEECP